MPPRGERAQWLAAVNHGATIPGDAQALYLCCTGHRFLVVGPHVALGQNLYVNVTNGFNRVISAIRREGGLIARACCGCGDLPLHSRRQRVTIPRETQLIARAAYRFGGPRAVLDILDQVGPTVLPVQVCTFRYGREQDRDHISYLIATNFPATTMPWASNSANYR